MRSVHRHVQVAELVLERAKRLGRIEKGRGHFARQHHAVVRAAITICSRAKGRSCRRRRVEGR